MAFKDALDKYYKLPLKKQKILFKPFMISPATSLIFSTQVTIIYLMVPTFSSMATLVYFIVMTIDIRLGYKLIDYLLEL